LLHCRLLVDGERFTISVDFQEQHKGFFKRRRISTSPLEKVAGVAAVVLVGGVVWHLAGF
tara:strand:- start:559 stop:738 length:180 start_codon:yes stop_codon:yes gene_type:complete